MVESALVSVLARMNEKGTWETLCAEFPKMDPWLTAVHFSQSTLLPSATAAAARRKTLVVAFFFCHRDGRNRGSLGLLIIMKNSAIILKICCLDSDHESEERKQLILCLVISRTPHSL